MFSGFKKIFKDSKKTNNGSSEDTDEEKKADESSTSAAKTIVCQGGKCSCNQSETPTQISLKVTTQSKFYVNDENGSEKLIASTMELGQPFDAPFFGKCKLQPSGSSFLPCQPAITKWQNPYENVELANGGKILTEESTAMCAIGGMIKIEDHGQAPAQVNEAQIQNGTLGVTTLLNPMITEADLEILAGGGFDGDTTDDKGASVKKITTIDSKTKYIKDQWISFKVSKWYNENAADKDKVNWVVYDDAGETLHTYQDKGELLDVRFSEDGTYKIEAYGGSAGGTKAATYTVTIKKPELNRIDKNVAAKIRPGEQATFTLAVDMPEVLDVATVEDVQWAVYKSTNKGRTYTEIVEDTVAGNTYKETVTFAEKGYYKIKATREEKTVETTLRVGLNGVTMIQLDKTSMRTHNDTIKLKVPDNAYSIKPPTAEEKQMIKWIVYDSAFNEVTELSGITGETFQFSDHKTEGLYYVEAYMNSSEISRIKAGKSSSCIKKVTVSTPSVKRVEWTDSKGRYKTTCGFDEEVYVKLKIDAFNGQKIKLKFYNIQKDSSKISIAETRAIKVDNKGEVHYKIKFDKNTYKEKLTNGSQKQTGYVVYEVLPDDDKEVIQHAKAGMQHFEHSMKINVKSKAAIAGVFYEKANKRVRNVRFDDTITCHIKSYNLIDKTVTINLYRYDRALGFDNLNPDDKVSSFTAIVDKEGKASFDFDIEKGWNGWVGTRETFYIEVADVPWYSKAIRAQGVIVGFTKKDKLQNQVNPVVVEQASGTTKKKKGRCKNCNKDITVDDIKSVYSEVDETGLQAAVDFLNSQRSFFGLTTCTRKAHFLAQLAAESGFTYMEESFKYKYKALRDVGLVNFNSTNDPNRTRAKEWGYGYDGRTKSQITKADERSIANWAYGKLPKASGLGNNPITSNWSDENADGWKYRGSGFIQLTGKSNFRATSKLYNSWIATDNSGLDKEDLVSNPDKLRTDKSIAMAAALIYWKNNNLLTRSDMGVGTDALGAITYKINTKFAGWAHRESYLEKAVETLKVEDCEDYVRRKGQKGSVVFVSGSETKIIKVKGRDNVVYKTFVYRGMTLEKFNELKDNDSLPEADYTTFLTRDAHQSSSERFDVQHSKLRYSKHNECPPGNEYYLNNQNDADGSLYTMYVSDSSTGSTIEIKTELADEMDTERSGIAIHQYDRKFSVGCLTLASSKDTTPVKALYNAIPDLFIHDIMKGKKREDENGVNHDMNIERRFVRIVIEEREVNREEKDHENFDQYIWTGIDS